MNTDKTRRRSIGDTRTLGSAPQLQMPRLHGLRQDLRQAFRRLVREPRFTVVAVLFLAAGIAGCTVMFSVVNAVLLRPFNIEAPGRVVVMWPVQHDVVGEFSSSA